MLTPRSAQSMNKPRRKARNPVSQAESCAVLKDRRREPSPIVPESPRLRANPDPDTSVRRTTPPADRRRCGGYRTAISFRRCFEPWDTTSVFIPDSGAEGSTSLTDRCASHSQVQPSGIPPYTHNPQQHHGESPQRCQPETWEFFLGMMPDETLCRRKKTDHPPYRSFRPSE